MTEGKKVLLVGPFISHVVGSKVELLRNLGCIVHVFNVGRYDRAGSPYAVESFSSWALDNRTGWRSRLSAIKENVLGSLRSYGCVPEREDVSAIVCELMQRIAPDIIWGLWGSRGLKWLRAFRRNGFKGKMVWTANVFPDRIAGHRWIGLSEEGSLYRRWLHEVDGLILTNKRMLEYMKHAHPNSQNSRCLLMPDYLPTSWFDDTEKTFVESVNPHVGYLGAPERYIDMIDNVDSHLLELARSGIHVHCAKPAETLINHSHIHFYERFDDQSFLNGEFGRFIGRWDAAIVLYNFNGYHPRFASTFPTRFLVALCGRIPIFVKKGGLLSCEAFVEENGIGKCYSDADELKCILSDHDLMKQLRKNATNNARYFSSDCGTNYERMRDFLGTL